MNRPPVQTLLAVSALSLGLAACTQPPAPEAAARPVFVTTVQPAGMTQERTFTAVVRARIETDLGFRTGGKVSERLVDPGDAVKAGQVLARLDPQDYALAVQAAADQVEAAAVDAQQTAADEARFRRLVAEGSMGAADHERQKARADAAQARLNQARRQLELARNRDGYTALVAPYAGVITATRVDAGQVVSEGLPVISMARDAEREIVVDLPEDWVDQARSLSAVATPWTDPARGIRLVLRELSPIASAQGRTFRARYAAAAASRAALAGLPLGSTAQLTLSSAQAGPKGVSLPTTALLKASAGTGVWVVNPAGSGLVFTPVQVLAMTDASVQVAGLAAGQQVVTVGAQKLDGGLKVRPVERPAAVTDTAAGKVRS